MLIDSIDTSDLSTNAQEAFITFERKLHTAYEKTKIEDRQSYRGSEYEYLGSYEPDRAYVGSILSFVDVYKLNYDLADITEFGDDDFPEHFRKFLGKINRLKTTFTLLRSKDGSDGIGTPILIASNYKEEITKNLQTIRKIINQEVKDQNKRDAIFKKLNALQAEIDRDRTTIDALFSRMIDFSKIVDECAENCEPLVSKVERLSNTICKVVDRVPLLASRERPKLITSEPNPALGELMDDEIPF